MTIPYLKGWGDTLAEDLPSLGNSIAHIANPNMDFQRMLKETIAKNPQLLQEIANNPGLGQALQGMGAKSDPSAGMQVDPIVAANRTVAGSNARVATATENPRIQSAQSDAEIGASNAKVATATEQPRIALAKSEATSKENDIRFGDLKYKAAKADFDRTAAAIAAYPNPNIKSIGDAIISGDRIDPQQVSALDDAGQAALKMYVDAANKTKERIKDISVAQLVHHSGNQQDRQQNLQLLKGLSVDLRGQLTAANQTVNNFKLDPITRITAQKEPPTTDIAAHQAWEAATTAKQQYEDAKKVLNENSELNQMLKSVDAKFAALIGLDMAGHNTPNTPQNATVNPNADPKIEQAKKMFQSGKASIADVNDLLRQGIITKQQADDIISSGKPQSINDTLKKITTLPEPAKPKPRKIPGVVSDR